MPSGDMKGEGPWDGKGEGRIEGSVEGGAVGPRLWSCGVELRGVEPGDKPNDASCCGV